MRDQFETPIHKGERKPELRQAIGSDWSATGLHPQRSTHVQPTRTVHELRAAHAWPRGRDQPTDRRGNRLRWAVSGQRQGNKLETLGHRIKGTRRCPRFLAEIVGRHPDARRRTGDLSDQS